MVSSIDPKEESWNHLQRQLSNQRKNRDAKRTQNVKQRGLKSNNNSFSNLDNFNNNNNNSYRINNNSINDVDLNNNNNNVNSNGNHRVTNRNLKPSKYATYINNSPTINRNKLPNSNNSPTTINNAFNNNSNQNSNNNPNMNNIRNYTPIQTPPRLRALQNNDINTSNPHILPGIQSPYSSARNNIYYNEAPNLESWGITNQTRINDDLYSLYRYNPSPLMPTGYTSYSYMTSKERKPYMVVPSIRRHYFDSPVSLSLESPNLAHYNYIQSKPYRPVQFSSLATRIERATDEYDYFKTNTAFSNNYIEEFISKTLQDQIIPDILIETIANVKREEKFDDKKKVNFKDPVKDEASLLLNRVNTNLEDNQNDNDLFSTKFLEDLEYKARIPARTEPKRKLVSVIDDDDYEPEPLIHISRKPTPVQTILIDRYVKDSLANDIAQQLHEEESKRLEEMRFLEKLIETDFVEPTVLKMCKEIAAEVLGGYKKQVDILQQREIKKTSDAHLMETLMVDHLLNKLASHGRLIAENDDVNKLLDTMMIDILLYTQNDVRKIKSKTIDNYPLKKFHLNSFMNVALDALVAELSASLEDDMKELEIEEKKFLKQ